MTSTPSRLLSRIDRRFILFLFVGGVNTLFGYSVFVLLTFLQLAPSLALLLSTVAGVLFNFKTTGGIVFANRNNRLIVKFVLVYSLLYGINLSLLKVLMATGLGVYVASASLVIPMALLSFILNKRFVFSEGT